MNILYQCVQLKPLGNQFCTELWQQVTILQCDAGEYIWQRDQTVKSVYVLLEGAVYFSEIDKSGNEIVSLPQYSVNLFGASQVFLNSEKYKNYSRALTHSTVAVFNKSHLLEQLESNPAYLKWWLVHMTERAQAVKNLRIATIASSPEDKITQTIAEACKHNDSIKGKHVFPFTQELFANMLGLSRRVVNKTLNNLAKSGYIELKYGKIIVNKPVLKRLIFKNIKNK